MTNQNYWDEIVNNLKEKGLTVATMESCTGGGISSAITNVYGASAVLSESYVTYSNDAKIKQGVRESVIEKYSVYSYETAIEMAKAVKTQAGSDIGIGVTGQLGRIDPNNHVDKLNIAWFAIVNQNDEVYTKEIHVPDAERMEQKDYVIKCVARELIALI